MHQSIKPYYVDRVRQESRTKAVTIAHIYPPVTGQRQTLTYWTIRTLFITTTVTGKLGHSLKRAQIPTG